MTNNRLGFKYGNAICYSGYRENQSPVDQTFPSYEQVCEDLRMLNGHWQYIRLYDSSPHADLVLDAIRDEDLDLRVMLGVDMRAEVSNPNCPWGAEFDEQQLLSNRQSNKQQVDRLIELANLHRETVFSVSVGNEATVEWTDHMVPVETLTEYVRKIKRWAPQPVTFCENYVPWTNKLETLAAELDFISIHTYPVWEFQTIENAMEYTRQNYYSVAEKYPNKPIVITEAGWTTTSNGRGIEPWNASEELQSQYYRELMDWSQSEQILTFVFEAFDEPWKGSPDPAEPEKHWGLFTVDRKPKQVMKELFAG